MANYAVGHEWSSGDTAPRILKLGTRSPHLRGNSSGIHWRGHWAIPRASVNAVEKRHTRILLFVPVAEPRLLGLPVRNLTAISTASRRFLRENQCRIQILFHVAAAHLFVSPSLPKWNLYLN